MLSKIMEPLKSGCKTPNQLAQSTGLSIRQVYRYLNEGKDSGEIVKVLPGVYGVVGSIPPSFDEFISTSSKMSMSKKQQHNKTIHNGGHNNLDFLSLNHEVPVQMQDSDPRNSESFFVSLESKMSLRETTTLILSVAKLDYSEFELKLAMNKLRDVRWNMIDQSNVEELVKDARGRYLEAQQKYGNIEYPIPYLFGIIRRMMISSLVKQRQEDYKSFVMDYVAAGAENCTVAGSESMTQDEPEIPQEQTVLTPEWEAVKDTIKAVAEERSVRFISETYIEKAVRYLADQGHFAERVITALCYMKENDYDGSCYLLENISNMIKVEEAVSKNWRRYQKRINPYKEQVHSSQANHTKKTRDDRYSAFYELYPEL